MGQCFSYFPSVRNEALLFTIYEKEGSLSPFNDLFDGIATDETVSGCQAKNA